MSLVVAALERVARVRPSGVAIEQAGVAVRYGELIASVEESSRRLRREGLVPGDAVVLQADNVARLVEGALAVRAAGGVACLAPGGELPFRARFSLGMNGPQALLRPLEAMPDRLPDGTAWVRVTSGTTGSARAVAFTEEQALASALRSAGMMGLEASDALVSTLPAATAYGWTAGVMGPLLAGARTIHRDAWNLRGLLAAADGVAWILASPPAVRGLARLEPDARSARRPRILTAAARYPDDAARACGERHGLAVIDRYGVAECGPVAQADEPDAVLRVAAGVSVRARQDGRLEVASDGVGIGYVGEQAGFAGRFTTADLTESLGDGRFHVVARADRIVRRAGRSVDLARVERLLVSLPGVARAHVEARPGALDLQLVARVRPSREGLGDVAALEARLREKLEPWERPSRIEVAGEDEVTAKWEGPAC
jgi:acyl-coenzyme A synthetase/AMP-(fatty) acid ligase